MAPIVDLTLAPEHPLAQDELENLVRDLAAAPELWSDLRPDGGDQRAVRLGGNEQLDVWLVRWDRETDTGYHDHGCSRGAAICVHGSMTEYALRRDGEPAARPCGPGDVVSFDGAHIHRILHGCDGGPGVSIHAYSPTPAVVGWYRVADDGVLRREQHSWLEEHRP